MWNMHGNCSCNGGLQAQLFFFYNFIVSLKTSAFIKNEDQTKREQKGPFHTIARTKTNKKSCSDLLEFM